MNGMGKWIAGLVSALMVVVFTLLVAEWSSHASDDDLKNETADRKLTDAELKVEVHRNTVEIQTHVRNDAVQNEKIMTTLKYIQRDLQKLVDKSERDG